MSKLVEIEDFTMSIGSRQVLRGVSLEVDRGEAVGIVGESGSGKTLTLRSVIGIVPEHADISGQVRLNGRSVFELPEPELRALRSKAAGMIFQDPHSAINPVYRIGDFLTEPFRRAARSEKAAAKERARNLLADLQIVDPDRVLRSYPHELSGGMLQRVMIGAALMGDPPLLLADEPTTALDVSTQAEVLAIMKEVCDERGTALVLITHDIEVATAVCDRLLVMYRGKVIEEITAEQILSGDITEPYTQALLACRPDVGKRQERLPVVSRDELERRYVA